MTSYVFITGGVVSSLGKGITSACLGAILEARGLTISMIKLDPYINVDPGTMSPFQHGEVFVTHDGTETDLDLGHYERFAGVVCSQASNYTTGRIYSNVIARERAGGRARGAGRHRPAGLCRRAARRLQTPARVLSCRGPADRGEQQTSAPRPAAHL